MELSNLTWLWLWCHGVVLFWQYLISRFDGWWHHRYMAGGVAVAWYIATFGLIFITGYPPLLQAAAAAVTLYLIVNAARLWANRFNPTYLRHAVFLNAWVLTLLLGILAGGYELAKLVQWHDGRAGLGFLLSVSAATGLFLVWQTYRSLRRYRAGAITPVVKERELPTVTLAIPARNETHALEETLSLAVKSDYPKLEIVVLDDCSQDQTAQVIRSFAHDGVRFVQGKAPADGWLGKNYACQVLAEEASGEIIIFAGVDTHFEDQSISLMVSYMLRQKAEMVSVLPIRSAFDFWPTFLEQLRNFWQIALPITSRRLPISNPCWMIWADSLRRIGGFASVRNSIFPEYHFARALQQKHGYRFIFSDVQTEVTTRKRLSSQASTATRTFYPMLKRRPAWVCAATFFLLAVAITPFGVLLSQFWVWRFDILGIVSAVAVLSFTVAHVAVLRHTNPKGWIVGLVNFPLLIVLDSLLFNWSMLAFEFGEVNWKGRNVCYPIIETFPKRDFLAQLDHKSDRHS